MDAIRIEYDWESTDRLSDDGYGFTETIETVGDADEGRCVDLEAVFPDYWVGYEDSLFAATHNLWHKTLACQCGHISPAGGSKLWACTKGRRNEAAALFAKVAKGKVEDDRFTVRMDGDDGLNVEFDIADAEYVLNLMGAKRR